MHVQRNLIMRNNKLHANYFWLTFNVTLSFHLRTIESARKSFHVTKLWNVSPVVRSHVMNVLRCVDMPRHDISDAVNFASAIAFLTVVTIDCHRSSGLISTNPGCGYNNSIWMANELNFIEIEVLCDQIDCFYLHLSMLSQQYARWHRRWSIADWSCRCPAML